MKVPTKLVQVVDNNCIDREVAQFRPTHVIIEALWVVPDKFDILTRFHPSVKWIVRNHSNIPFLSNEGMAVEWLIKYIRRPNVFIAMNNEEARKEFIEIICQHHMMRLKDARKHVVYFPNYYKMTTRDIPHKAANDILDFSCYGAIRPLKNHLKQVVAAISYARRKKKKLNFHINATRLEGNGAPILKNIRALFEGQKDIKLVEHPWVAHEDFLDLMAQMDLSMQVSYSETFNIVSADAVSVGTPVVVSPEISWVPSMFQADPNDTESIITGIDRALFWNNFITRRLNKMYLNSYNQEAKDHILEAIDYDD
ncbi:MAG: glycosyltransferase family 1 protein [Candidatus Nitrosotenuis sp.]